MAKVTRYGTAFLQFGVGDKGLSIEVQRSQAQRPVWLSASFEALPVPAQQNSLCRVIVYRAGAPLPETHIHLDSALFVGSTALGNTWDATLGDVNAQVLYDQQWQYGQQPIQVDFDNWPDEVCKTDPGQFLGAFVFQPVDMTNAASLNGAAILTFWGKDLYGVNEPSSGSIPDVRNLKAV